MTRARIIVWIGRLPGPRSRSRSGPSSATRSTESVLFRAASHGGAVGRLGRHLVATLVPRPVTLTVVRIVVPGTSPAVRGRRRRARASRRARLRWPAPSARRLRIRLDDRRSRSWTGPSYATSAGSCCARRALVLLGPVELVAVGVVAMPAAGRAAARRRQWLARRGRDARGCRRRVAGSRSLYALRDVGSSSYPPAWCCTTHRRWPSRCWFAATT